MHFTLKVIQKEWCWDVHTSHYARVKSGGFQLCNVCVSAYVQCKINVYHEGMQQLQKLLPMLYGQMYLKGSATAEKLKINEICTF